MRRASAYLPEPAQERFLRLLFEPQTPDSLASRLEGFEAVVAGSEVSSLLPLLAKRRGTALPQAIQAQALDIRNYLAFRNQILFTRLAGALQYLEAAGIPTMILKGAAMIQTCYQDPGLRFMEDADFMVPQENVPQALDLLSSVGLRWVRPKRLSPAMFAARHHIDMTSGDGAKLELHWHLFGLVWHPGTDAPFWKRSRPASFRGIGTRILCPEDQVLHTCVHAASYQTDRPLRWIADIMNLLEQNPGIDWDLVCGEARARQFCLSLGVALSYLKDQLGAPIPDHALAALAGAPISSFERADFAGRTNPQNAFSKWQRRWLMWRRYREWISHGPDPGRRVGFPVFMQHSYHRPSLSGFLVKFLKQRFR